jgi:hypothetical protein
MCVIYEIGAEQFNLKCTKVESYDQGFVLSASFLLGRYSIKQVGVHDMIRGRSELKECGTTESFMRLPRLLSLFIILERRKTQSKIALFETTRPLPPPNANDIPFPSEGNPRHQSPLLLKSLPINSS